MGYINSRSSTTSIQADETEGPPGRLGEKGPQGPRGEDGLQHPKGDKGDPGPGMKDDGKMDADLDMDNHGIRNLQTPMSYSIDVAVNVAFFNQQVNASNTNLFEQLTKDYIAYVNRSLLTPSHWKDTFRYLMEDGAEATSEYNIRVLGISDFPNSPHQVNRKAYNIQLVLGEDIQYRSRIGFNLHPLLVGYYTMIVEFFPPEITNVSTTPKATTISISNFTSTIFTKHTKTLINFHRWKITPP